MRDTTPKPTPPANITLRGLARMRFLKAMRSPAPPTSALIKLLNRYKQEIQSRD